MKSKPKNQPKAKKTPPQPLELERRHPAADQSKRRIAAPNPRSPAQSITNPIHRSRGGGVLAADHPCAPQSGA